MPKASNFLVDADMLKKQAPVAAPIIAQHVNSQAFIPNTAYHPSFGQPNSLMPTAASAMPQQMAKPKATTVARAPHRAASVRRSNSNVAGRLVKRPPAQSVVADYGKNFGYVPGSTLPSRQPDVSSRQEVSGKVLRY